MPDYIVRLHYETIVRDARTANEAKLRAGVVELTNKRVYCYATVDEIGVDCDENGRPLRSAPLRLT